MIKVPKHELELQISLWKERLSNYDTFEYTDRARVEREKIVVSQLIEEALSALNDGLYVPWTTLKRTVDRSI